MSNRIKYPEAWAFFVEHARNIEEEDEGKIAPYRIPKPDRSGDFIYADCPGKLFRVFLEHWHKPSLDSPSVRGKIQHIVKHLNG